MSRWPTTCWSPTRNPLMVPVVSSSSRSSTVPSFVAVVVEDGGRRAGWRSRPRPVLRASFERRGPNPRARP